MQSDHPLRRARWIWPGGVELAMGTSRNIYAHFRHDFQLASRPKRAPFFISADQQYMLYVNGQYVGRGPARGFQQSWPYDQFDLAGLLRRGHNWIAVRAYNCGTASAQYIHQWMAGMICAGVWSDAEVVSGDGWLARLCPAHRRDTHRLSKQTHFQEHVDAGADGQEWIRSARKPGRFEPVGRSAAFGSMPWHAMEPRGLANLTADLRAYRNAVSAASGECAAGYADADNPAAPLVAENRELRWKPAEAVARDDDGIEIELPATGPDRMAAVLVDMGRPVVGNLLVDARGGRGGELLDLYFTEAANDDGSPVLSWPDHVAMAARLRLAPERTRYEFFQPVGHRYVIAIARNTRRAVRVRLAMRHTVYPLEIAGRFDCDDGQLNDIHRICEQTQQVCALDSYVDTPWREQAQWWGDARVQCVNTFRLSGQTELMVRGIRQIATQGVPNGLTYAQVPTTSHRCILPDFSLIWAITLWDYWRQTGDASLAIEQWPRLERLLEYFTGEGRGDNGLLRYDDRYWLFLDWADIHKEGYPALLSLWYLYALDRLAELAAAAGMDDRRRRLKRLAGRQRRLTVEAFWDGRRKLFRDGLTDDGRNVDCRSAHTQTLAILCGLQRDHHRRMAERRIVPHLTGEPVEGAVPSTYWFYYVHHVAARMGFGGEVLRHIRDVWGPMVRYEGTRECFKWDVGVISVSHAWAAHPMCHLAELIGGVVQRSVAWRQIDFAPLLDADGVARAEVTQPTPQGLIRSTWQRDGRTARGTLELPRGVSADVRLPGVRRRTVTGRYEWEAPVAAR